MPQYSGNDLGNFKKIKQSDRATFLNKNTRIDRFDSGKNTLSFIYDDFFLMKFTPEFDFNEWRIEFPRVVYGFATIGKIRLIAFYWSLIAETRILYGFIKNNNHLWERKNDGKMEKQRPSCWHFRRWDEETTRLTPIKLFFTVTVNFTTIYIFSHKLITLPKI